MSNGRIAIIQLARRGDVVNMLPVAHELHRRGLAVDWYVHRDFADVLEPCAYVNPVVWDGTHRDVAAAAAAAEASGRYERVLVTQVDGNDTPPPVECENFITQSWSRAGFLPDFHNLPLVFDRRDAAGEAKAVGRFVPHDDGRPLLVYCLHGHSSPFYGWQATQDWLHAAFGARYRLCEVGGREQLAKPHHLLGILERADVLVSIDTLTLHLGHAFNVPTVALSRGVPWYQSEPRRHWLGRLTYEQVGTDAGREHLRSLLLDGDVPPRRRRPEATDAPAAAEPSPPLARDMADVAREKVFHVVDWHIPGPDRPGDRARILDARKTWEALRFGDHHWEIVWHETARHARRTSRDLGDARSLPYLRDLFDFAADAAEAAGLPDAPLVLTNADIGLCPEAADAVRRKLSAGPCCYSRRVDVPDAARVHTRAELALFPAHVGADLFACRASWWRKHRDEVPDLLLGCEGWDFVGRRVWERHHPAAEISPPVIYHERHDPYWSWSANLTDNAGQRHNRRECLAWAEACGLGYMTGAGPGARYLFKPDSELRR